MFCYFVIQLAADTVLQNFNEPLGGSSCRAKPTKGFFILMYAFKDKING